MDPIDTLLEGYDEEEFRALAGLSKPVFRVLYHKYCGAGTPICKPVYLFVLFKYYKLYPVERAWSTIFPGKRSRRSLMFRLRVWEVLKLNKILSNIVLCAFAHSSLVLVAIFR